MSSKQLIRFEQKWDKARVISARGSSLESVPFADKKIKTERFWVRLRLSTRRVRPIEHQRRLEELASKFLLDFVQVRKRLPSLDQLTVAIKS